MLTLQFLLQKIKRLLISVFLLAATSALAQTVTVGGSGNGLGIIYKLAEAYAKIESNFQFQVLPSIGSGGVAKGLSNRSLDLGLMSRPLKDEEKGTTLHSILMARSPLILASSRSAEKGLTRNQLEEIYSGKVTKWPDGRRIRLVLRPVQDSDTQLLGTVSIALHEALKAAASKEGMTIAITDQDAANKLENLPGSLGTTTLGLLRTEQRRFHALNLDAIPPVLDGKANPAYPLQKQLFLVWPADAAPQLKRFIQFIQSQEGNRILERNGYLSVTR